MSGAVRLRSKESMLSSPGGWRARTVEEDGPSWWCLIRACPLFQAQSRGMTFVRSLFELRSSAAHRGGSGVLYVPGVFDASTISLIGGGRSIDGKGAGHEVRGKYRQLIRFEVQCVAPPDRTLCSRLSNGAHRKGQESSHFRIVLRMRDRHGGQSPGPAAVWKVGGR